MPEQDRQSPELYGQIRYLSARRVCSCVAVQNAQPFQVALLQHCTLRGNIILVWRSFERGTWHVKHVRGCTCESFLAQAHVQCVCATSEM